MRADSPATCEKAELARTRLLDRAMRNLARTMDTMRRRGT